MQIGVQIKAGVQDWQIIQQKNGVGAVTLEGSYNRDNLTGPVHVYVRVVFEDSGEIVKPWKEADLLGENEWKITITDIPAGGLYRIESMLRDVTCIDFNWAMRGDMIFHVGVGDVFVIAGQSNSAGYGKDHVCDGPELGVHILKNSDRWDLAVHPLNDSTNTKHEVNREGANSGASPYLSFAKYLKKRLGYPIGLIQTSLGGSPMAAWNPAESGELYRNMVGQIKSQGTSAAGVLWYQGCSDTVDGLSYGYEEKFVNMVETLREELKDPELPFFTVQLNRCTAKPDEHNTDEEWSVIREIQRTVVKKMKNLYVIPSIDGALCDEIHNTSYFNIVLGERLAKMALAKLYGKDSVCEAPNLVSAEKTDEHHVELTFEFVYGAILVPNTDVAEIPFVVQDEDGRKKINGCEMHERSKVILSFAEALGNHLHISYCYGRNPKGACLVDSETHYPVIPFYDIETGCRTFSL